jgi:beta-lactamase superfamily II metal-dependent hydrolase
MPNSSKVRADWRRFVKASLLISSLCAFFVAVLPVLSHASPPLPNAKPLQIYFVDVEGGQATLFVTPEGNSLLIDTGWPDNNGRDADRIVTAAKLAGLSKIDFVLLTHYHQDHAGGVTQLAAKIPLGTFIDHGENSEPPESSTGQMFRDYQALLAKENHKRIVAKSGDALPLKGIHATIVSSDGAVIDKPLPSAGAENPTCDTTSPAQVNPTENNHSLGVLFIFGKLRILDLGDLTSDKERLLMCPVNKLGAIDILVVSHHGTVTSNSPELLNGIAPRVAVIDNGATKGGSPLAWDTVKKSPRLEDLWQLHYSNEGGAEHNVADYLIANPAGSADAGNYLKLTAFADGSYNVYNSRTQATKHYAPNSSH